MTASPLTRPLSALLMFAISTAPTVAGPSTDAYRALDQAFEQAVGEFMDAYRDAASEHDRQRLLDDPKREPRARFTPRFAAAAAERGGRPEAVPFLVWLVRHGWLADRAAGAAALERLLDAHLRDPGLAALPPALWALRDLRGAERTRESLNRLLAGTGSDPVRAAALLYRGRLAAAGGRYQQAAADLQRAIELAAGSALADDAAGQLAALARPVVGAPSPPLTGPLADGGQLRAGDLAGHVVLVDFWGLWCGPCVAQLPRLARLAARFADRPSLAVIGVNSDADVEAVAAFLARHGPPWRHLLDRSTGGPLARAWGVTAWPRSFLVDRRGIVRYAGDDLEALEDALHRLLPSESDKSDPQEPHHGL